ncbi:TPA: hypothetical protein ACH3X1_005317 [Trebouxia sp. C0004]
MSKVYQQAQGTECLTFLYTPDNDTSVNSIVAAMRSNNSPAIPDSRTKGFGSMSEADAYLFANPQTTLGAVHFNVTDAQHISFTLQSNSSTNWFKGHYQNPNTYFQLPLQMAVERETARHLANGSNLGWDVSYTDFAHPASQSASVVGNIAPTFFFASVMFNFVVLLHNLVSEKESGVRQVMSTMGLLTSPFWLTWALFEGVQALVSTLLILAASYAFHFDIMWQNSFWLSFLLLLLTNLALVSFCFFISTFLRHSSTAVPAGFGLFIVAWVMLLVVAFGFPYSTNYSSGLVALFSLFPWTILGKGIGDLASATTGDGSVGISWSHRYSYCQSQTPSSSQQQSLGYYTTSCVAPLPHLFLFAVAQCIGYMVLAVYLDKVLPDRMGVRLPFWYPLLPSYWKPTKTTSPQHAAAALQLAAQEEDSPTDADVAAEVAAMQAMCAQWISAQSRSVQTANSRSHGKPAHHPQLNGGLDNSVVQCVCHSSSCEDAGHLQAYVVPSISADLRENGAVVLPEAGSCDRTPEQRPDGLKTALTNLAPERQCAISMFGLRRSFVKRPALWRRLLKKERSTEAVAVKGNWLGIQQGECFCLLGPNGAGKSTTINCLTGVLPATAGEAVVYGSSITHQGGLDRVRGLMGVCLQFDVLWDNLTGREHLMLFGAIKGLDRRQAEKQADALLDQVKLGAAGGVRAGAYSGGMRRRLSLAVALLGNPKVLYLDEPTTGMDPISRRHLWDLIISVKQNCAIMLTTHSMEEADILGDRIGIMARGQLCCLGSGLHLKQRFGSGYRLSVQVQQDEHSSSSVQENRLQQIAAFVQQHTGAVLVDKLETHLHFKVPTEAESKLTHFFAQIKEEKDMLYIGDVQLRLTPLEEVFMAVAHEAEVKHAQHMHETTELMLNGGIALQVAMGASHAVAPDGQVYILKWVQDDNGRLHLQDHKLDTLTNHNGGAE